MKKIALFVDVQNIYYTCRQAHQRQFNYRALWQRLEQQGEIVVARAYAIERNDSQQHKFQNALRNIGFKVMLKPYIQRADGSAKGDWDVGIAIDVMDVAVEVDTVILLSGDGDFDLLLQRVQQKHQVETEVYGVRALTASSLAEAATYYHPIDNALLL